MRLVNALRSGLTGLTMAGGVAAVLGLASVSARADTIVSQLNCPIVGGTACTSTVTCPTTYSSGRPNGPGSGPPPG